MKVKLEFTLDFDNEFEVETYRRLTRINDIIGALYSVHNEFMELVSKSDDGEETISTQKVLDTINSCLEEYGINLEDLYS